MSQGTRRGSFLVLLGLIQAIAGCRDARAVSPASPSSSGPAGSAPSASTPQGAGAAANSSGGLVLFREPATGFSTTDLRDAADRVIQLTVSGDLVWTPDGTHVPGYQGPPDPYYGPPTYFISSRTPMCVEFCVFSVRFGSSNGERRAYLTLDYGHSNPGTIVDVEVRNGALVVTQTASYPPGTPTLSGRVTEMTASGEVPLAGAWVYRGVPAGWQEGVTDKNGIYKISGLIDGSEAVAAGKDGYENQQTKGVAIQGDTRFDIQLVRR